MIKKKKKGTDYISEPDGCQLCKITRIYRLIFMFHFPPFVVNFQSILSDTASMSSLLPQDGIPVSRRKKQYYEYVYWPMIFPAD